MQQPPCVASTNSAGMGKAETVVCALLLQITKAMDVTIDRSGPIPKIHFKNKESYNTSKCASLPAC